MELVLRPGGDTADLNKKSTLPLLLQELASAGPSAIESFGPEPEGEIVHVEISSFGHERQTFKLRCGLGAAGGGA